MSKSAEQISICTRVPLSAIRYLHVHVSQDLLMFHPVDQHCEGWRGGRQFSIGLVIAQRGALWELSGDYPAVPPEDTGEPTVLELFLQGSQLCYPIEDKISCRCPRGYCISVGLRAITFVKQNRGHVSWKIIKVPIRRTKLLSQTLWPNTKTLFEN